MIPLGLGMVMKINFLNFHENSKKKQETYSWDSKSGLSNSS